MSKIRESLPADELRDLEDDYLATEMLEGAIGTHEEGVARELKKETSERAHGARKRLAQLMMQEVGVASIREDRNGYVNPDLSQARDD